MIANAGATAGAYCAVTHRCRVDSIGEALALFAIVALVAVAVLWFTR